MNRTIKRKYNTRSTTTNKVGERDSSKEQEQECEISKKTNNAKKYNKKTKELELDDDYEEMEEKQRIEKRRQLIEKSIAESISTYGKKKVLSSKVGCLILCFQTINTDKLIIAIYYNLPDNNQSNIITTPSTFEERQTTPITDEQHSSSRSMTSIDQCLPSRLMTPIKPSINEQHSSSRL